MHGNFYDYPLLKGDDDVPSDSTRKGAMPLQLHHRGSGDSDETERAVREGLQTALVGYSGERPEETKKGKV